jgi:hypothetical protein
MRNSELSFQTNDKDYALSSYAHLLRREGLVLNVLTLGCALQGCSAD